MSQTLEKAGQLDILHANAGIYIGGDLVDAKTDAIDRMLNLNVNVVMKNVHDVLPQMTGGEIEGGKGIRQANVVMFMLTRPRGMTIRDVVMLPTNFDI
jgi:NADP-dependent 3-hydroxy acid dehydrogenase YdfG